MSGKYAPFAAILQAIAEGKNLQVRHAGTALDAWKTAIPEYVLVRIARGELDPENLRVAPTTIRFFDREIPAPEFGIPGEGTPVYFATSEGRMDEVWSGTSRQILLRRGGLMHWAPEDAEEHSQALSQLRKAFE